MQTELPTAHAPAAENGSHVISDEEHGRSLVRELAALPRETGWLEFKLNKAEPQEIGEYISALANSAALERKGSGYLVWGVDDATHAMVGTHVDPGAQRVGNEELENWLLRRLQPKIEFQFETVNLDGYRLVVLKVSPAFRHPVQFSNMEYVRVGSHKKPLKDFQEKERALWRTLDVTPFEQMAAAERLDVDDVTRLLDYPAYFSLMSRPVPDDSAAILQLLEADRLVRREDAGGWTIANLGAVLFARRLSDFGRLRRKALRVIAYRGPGRIDAQQEYEVDRGYAAGFEALIADINGLLPRNEVMGQALRKVLPVYPELAVRELVANALIHQDFAVEGSGPMVEIFSNRVEVSNPGAPLMDADRLLDLGPRSRNEALASLMRRVGICEERGSGVDKVVAETERHQLPAPAFELVGGFTRSSLFAPMPLGKMEKVDRNRAVYLHACLRYVQRDSVTNGSLRERFGIDLKNSATASRLLKDAVAAGVIRLVDPEAPPKLRRYKPHWA